MIHHNGGCDAEIARSQGLKGIHDTLLWLGGLEWLGTGGKKLISKTCS